MGSSDWEGHDILKPFRFEQKFQDLGAAGRAVTALAAAVRDALSPVLSWAPLDSVDLEVTFAAGSTSSGPVAHKLNAKPNRIIQVMPHIQTVQVASWDDRLVTFTRSSSSGDRTFYFRLYREPGSGDATLV